MSERDLMAVVVSVMLMNGWLKVQHEQPPETCAISVLDVDEKKYSEASRIIKEPRFNIIVSWYFSGK